MPGDDAQRQWLDLVAADLRSQADEQRAGADAVDGLAGDGLLSRWARSQVEAELEQQLEEDVLLGAVGLQVLDGRRAASRPRLSRSGSHARMLLESSLKTRKPRSPANSGFSSRIFLPARRRRSLVSSAMLRGLPSLSQKSAASSDLVLRIERFGKLNQDVATVAAIGGVLCHDGVAGGA